MSLVRSAALGTAVALVTWVSGCAVSSRHIIDPMRSEKPSATSTRSFQNYFLPQVASWEPRPLSPAAREDYASRPTLAGSFTFDFQSLPILGPVSGGSVEVVVPDRGAVLAESTSPGMPTQSLVAEVTAFERRQFTELTSQASLRFMRPFARQLEDARDAAPLCNGESRSTPALLRGFPRENWSSSGLDYAVYSGILDSCAGTLERTHATRARALVPGVLYAFRACKVGCDTAPAGTPPYAEELTIVGPPADWVSSSTNVAEQIAPHVGSFSILTVPIRPGSSAVVTMHIAIPNLAYFLGLPRPLPEWAADLNKHTLETIAFTIEVVWLESSSHADGVGYVSVVHPESAGWNIR